MDVAAQVVGRPWRVTGTEMPPPLLLMSKLLFLVLLFGGFRGKFDAPFLPFVPVLDIFRQWPWFYRHGLEGLFLAAGGLLWLNIRPRATCVLLGSVVILVLVGSKPLFRNHVFLVGCLFLLAGLTRPGGPPVLLYVQLSLLYLGAFLNKILLVDWLDGRFMDNFLANARENSVYLGLIEIIPRMWVANLLGWGSMFVELIIGLFFLFAKTRSAAVWIAVLFHFGMFVFLLGETFGHFFEDMLLAVLVVLAWPEKPAALYPRLLPFGISKLGVRLLDWDRTFAVVDASPPPAATDDCVVLDRVGWSYVLRHTTGFYMLLFAAYQATRMISAVPETFVVNVLIGTALILLMLPPLRPQRRVGRGRA